jgi:hypothetical protein
MPVHSFIFYLFVVFQRCCQYLEHRPITMTSNELEMMWNDAVVAQFVLLSKHLLEATDEKHESLSQDSGFLVSSNLGPPEREARAIRTSHDLQCKRV